jgi:hypothetical protein
MQPRRNDSHHAIRIIALAATLGLMTVALSQCNLVHDNVTGVTLQPGRLSGRSSCTHHCNESFEAALKVEESRHRNAIHACGGDHRCRDAEEKLHHKNVDSIDDARKACKKGCYNEGGGGHGDR